MAQQGRPDDNRNLKIGIAFFGVLVILAAAFLLLRDRGADADPTGGAASAEASEQLAGEAAATQEQASDAPAIDPQPQQSAEQPAAEPVPADQETGIDQQVHGESGLLSIPGTDIRIEPLSIADEEEIGRDIDELVFEQYPVANDPSAQAMLDGLLTAIIPDDGRNYRVTLVQSEEVNAFAVVGGSVYFTTAITDLLNESELAFVMAHEVAHINCRHTAQAFERQALASSTIEATLGTEIADDWFNSPELQLVDQLLAPQFSRDDERDADLFALELLRRVGLSTDGAADALRQLQAVEPNQQQSAFDQLFSSHPPTAERIAAIEAELADS